MAAKSSAPLHWTFMGPLDRNPAVEMRQLWDNRDIGILEHRGTGRGGIYVLRPNRAINVPIVPDAGQKWGLHPPIVCQPWTRHRLDWLEPSLTARRRKQ
jgi:hypothetical protein